MMKSFRTPASPFVHKCTVAIRELGLQDRVEIIPTKWPHSWGTEPVTYHKDLLAATPIARIPALVTDDGECLTESSLICEYLNDEHGGFRLCPQNGRGRFRRRPSMRETEPGETPFDSDDSQAVAAHTV